MTWIDMGYILTIESRWFTFVCAFDRLTPKLACLHENMMLIKPLNSWTPISGKPSSLAIHWTIKWTIFSLSSYRMRIHLIIETYSSLGIFSHWNFAPLALLRCNIQGTICTLAKSLLRSKDFFRWKFYSDPYLAFLDICWVMLLEHECMFCLWTPCFIVA